MATADKHVNLSVNRILGVDRFKENFLDYLRAYDQDIVASVFACSGVFDVLGLAADGNDKFKITGFTGKGVVGLDGAGNFLDLDARSADFETVQFENENAIDYHVGLKGEVLPESLAVSPIDGLPHWDRMEEIAGWEGTPDSVADNGDGTMTLKVNAVTESGPNRSGAGRQVAVYKKTIEKSAVTYAKALEICTVAWDATDNKITTTTWAAGGAGDFGQDTPSTTASDYTVVLIGPRVSRNTDLSTVPAWCYVGFVTGAGAGNPPAVFDVTGQNVMNIPLSDFTQITRYENVPPDRLKIDVKALAGEVGVDQIRVTKLGTGVTFSVNEAGNTLAGTLRLNHTDPKIDIENTDAGVDQKNWRWVTGTESLSLRSFDDAWINAMTAIQIIKDAGGANPYRIENMVFWADDHISLSSSGEIRVSDLVPSGNNWCGSAAKRFLGFYGMGLDLEISSGNVMIRLNDSGADPNEGIFKICNNDGQLCILSENDVGAIRDLMVFNKSDGDYRVTKVSIYSFDEFWIGGANKIGLGGSPSGISAIECFLDVIPDTDDSLNLGSIAAPNQRWQHGYFSKDVFARQLVAEGDSGGAASKTTFTNATAAAAAGDSQVYAGGNTNAGFIKIYVGATTAYVPYWTTIV